jgi:long-subunit fatty acid transport protein
LYPLPHPVKAENYYEMEAMDGMFKNYTADVEEERGQFVSNKGYMAVSMPDIWEIISHNTTVLWSRDSKCSLCPRG